MAKEFLSTVRFAEVAALPGGAVKGDACILSSNGHLYTFDGAAWVDNGATTIAAPVGGNQGSLVIDAGTSYTDEVDVSVTGQTGISATSVLNAWLLPVDTADHSAEEHMTDPPDVFAYGPIVGVGFTIRLVARSVGGIYGRYSVAWAWV